MTEAGDNFLPPHTNRLWRWLTVPSETVTWTGGNDGSALARRRGLVIFGLLFLVAVPRAVLAWQLDSVCDDAFYYMWVARMWEQGRAHTALQSLNINIYPLILCGMQQLGLEAVAAGKLWGVIVSGLTVLPLYGLVRRMFDDRVAVVSVLLFAVHPGLIELSVEPIREPTFWFLFLASLYLLHRSANQAHGLRSVGFAAGAGLAIALAVHTRTEGWILLIPLCLWTLCLSPSSVSLRRRLLRLTTAGCMIPALLVAVNLTLLHGHARWEWGRFTPLRSFAEWLRADVSRERPELQGKASEVRGPESGVRSQGKITAAGLIPAASVLSLSEGHTADLYLYVNLLGENFEYVNLLLMLAGSLVLGREMLRGDRLALSLIFGGILAMVWIRLAQVGAINGRYFLTAYFMAIPTEAVGIVWLLRLATVPLDSPMLRRAVTAAAGLFLMAFFWTNAFMGDHVERDSQVTLGRWLRARYGPFDVVRVDTRSARVGYFVRGQLPDVSYYNAGDGPPPEPPEIIIVRRPADPSVKLRASQLGMRALSPEAMPACAEAFEVFVPGRRPTAIADSDRARRR